MRMRVAVGGLAFANVICGVAFQWLILTQLGASRETDALFAAAAVSQLVINVVAGALGNVLVPLFSVAAPEDRSRLGWTFLQVGGSAFGVPILILIATAGWWTRWLAPGFSSADGALLVTLTRISLIAALGGTLTVVAWAALYARGAFLIAEATPLVATLMSLGILAGALPRWGVFGAAGAALARPVIHMLLNVPALGRYCVPDVSLHAVTEAWQRVRPLLGANLFTKTDVILDRALASYAPPGVLALFGFVQQGYTLGQLVLHRTVMAPAIPDLSRDVAQGRWVAFSAGVRRALVTMLAVTVPVAILVLTMGESLVRLLMAYGMFDGGDVATLWLLLVALLGVWIGGAVGLVTSGAFYAIGDTRTPTRVGVVTFMISIAVKIAAFRAAGVWGVAVVASVHYMANAAIIGILMRSRIRGAVGAST